MKKTFVCIRNISRMHPHVILVCICMLPICYSCVFVFNRMLLVSIRMLLVGTRMLSVCYSHVTGMYTCGVLVRDPLFFSRKSKRPFSNRLWKQVTQAMALKVSNKRNENTCKDVSILLRNLKLTLFYVMKPDDLKSTMPILKSVGGQGCGGMEAKGLKPP